MVGRRIMEMGSRSKKPCLFKMELTLFEEREREGGRRVREREREIQILRERGAG